MTPVEILWYQTATGRVPIAEWLDRQSDRATRSRVVARLDLLALGVFGDWKSVGGGVFELRMNFGPGYRIYFARAGTSLILLLLGGDKKTQARDIEKANAYWEDYKARSAP